MIFVCNDHVKKGLSVLSAPHVCRTVLESKCRFCDKKAQYEMELDSCRHIKKKTRSQVVI
jgi:hypothetical protein